MEGTDIYIISGTGKGGRIELGPAVWLTLANGKTILMPRQQYNEIMNSYATKPKIGAFSITADSEPVLDGWGWSEYRGCQDWMLWHGLNKVKHGQPAANQKFIQQWGAQSSDMSPYNWCKYNATFATYFADQGIEVGWLLSNLVVAVQNIPNAVIDAAGNLTTSAGNVIATAGQVAESLAHSAQNVGGGVEKVTTVIKWVAPVAAIVGAVWAFDKWVYPIFPNRKN